MRFILFLLLLVQLKAQQCAENPFLPQFQIFVSLLNNQNLTVLQQMNNYVAGSPISGESLTTCTQFKQSTCCTKQFEESLEQIVQLYVTNYQEFTFPFNRIMESLETSIKNCAVRDEMTFQSIYKAPIENLPNAIKEYRQNIAQLLLYNAKFIRGNLCILCSTPSQYATYIQSQTQQGNQQYQLKLQVDQTSFDDYLNKITDIFNKLQAQIPVFKTALEKYFTEYADTTKCSSILTKLTDYMENLQFCVGGDCKQHLLQRVNAFKQEMDDELIYLIQPNFGFSTSRFLTQQDSFVMLASGSGIKTFISNEQFDKTVEYQGEMPVGTQTTQGIMIVSIIVFQILFSQ